MFSTRFEWSLPTNPLGSRLKNRRAQNLTFVDLTESNPTRVGLDFPEQHIPRLLADPAAMTYTPDPRGLLTARTAIADYYLQQHAPADPQALFLTASTSEAYSMLFKLLADPGDEILIPGPGYPLLAYLCKFEGLRPFAYPLRYADDCGWSLDLEIVEALITSRTRAVVAVHPNNPTGSYISLEELRTLDRVCLRHNLALIVDEVFNDYQAPSAAGSRFSTLNRTRALTFVLNGFSKMVALPQFKLAWIAVGGDPDLAGAACDRLEILLDFYLAVNTPVQLAAPHLLALRETVQAPIRKRLNTNAAILAAITADRTDLKLLHRSGGWYAVIETFDKIGDEERALRLLDQANTLIHPGFFYDFHREGFVVLSLLPEEVQFREGVKRLINCQDG